MTLKVNGTSMEFEQTVSLLDIMKKLKIEDQVMAAAVNMQIVKKEAWLTYRPEDNDAIEMLHFVGGG